MQYLPELTEKEKATLFKHIGQINPSACNNLYNSSMVVDDNSASKSKVLSGMVAFQAEASDEEDAFGTAPKLQHFEGAVTMNLANMTSVE